MFDDFLRPRAAQHGAVRAVRLGADYNTYVDGKAPRSTACALPRLAGDHAARGRPNDPPRRETVDGLGNRKNDLVHELIRDHGVDVYQGSVRYLRAVRDAGLRRAVVSSANAEQVLQVAGLDRPDRRPGRRRRGRPRNLRASRPRHVPRRRGRLGVHRRTAAVFEDAIAGVQAGPAGGFGFVVGVDRVGHADEPARGRRGRRGHRPRRAAGGHA